MPQPPRRLIWRVGCPRSQPRLRAEYERRGKAMRDEIVSLLPGGWSFEGKRVLDFGCGAGRVLRHFLAEAEAAEIWGCDVHGPSIRWLRRHLSPPLRVFVNHHSPPLPHADGSFDLIWALSVFTHLTDGWSAWLLELRRVLRDGGLLIATFIGPGASRELTGEPWHEDRVGMNVLYVGRRWDDGGPVVLHSPWWIRAHWGRAFDIVSIRTGGFARDDGGGQGVVLLRKNASCPSREELERWEPDDPRELGALRHNLHQTQQELSRLRASTSWRATAPLRRVHSTWPLSRIRRGS